jgi:hypothetical protein
MPNSIANAASIDALGWGSNYPVNSTWGHGWESFGQLFKNPISTLVFALITLTVIAALVVVVLQLSGYFKKDGFADLRSKKSPNAQVQFSSGRNQSCDDAYARDCDLNEKMTTRVSDDQLLGRAN